MNQPFGQMPAVKQKQKKKNWVIAAVNKKQTILSDISWKINHSGLKERPCTTASLLWVNCLIIFFKLYFSHSSLYVRSQRWKAETLQQANNCFTYSVLSKLEMFKCSTCTFSAGLRDLGWQEQLTGQNKTKNEDRESKLTSSPLPLLAIPWRHHLNV